MVIVEMCRPRPGPGHSASTSSAAEARGKRRLPVNYLASCTQLRPSWTWTPTTDRDALASREKWVVEGIFLYGIEPLLERADLIVWLDLPARTAQRRIVVRHFYLSCRRRNRRRGLRLLATFVTGMRGYYDKPALKPTSATDWDALGPRPDTAPLGALPGEGRPPSPSPRRAEVPLRGVHLTHQGPTAGSARSCGIRSNACTTTIFDVL